MAESVQVSRPTVERFRKARVGQGPDSALTHRKPYRTRSRVLDGGRSDWALRLLADRAVELEIVPSIRHERVRQTLKNRAQALVEALPAYPASGECAVRQGVIDIGETDGVGHNLLDDLPLILNQHPSVYSNREFAGGEINAQSRISRNRQHHIRVDNYICRHRRISDEDAALRDQPVTRGVWRANSLRLSRSQRKHPQQQQSQGALRHKGHADQNADQLAKQLSCLFLERELSVKNF